MSNKLLTIFWLLLLSGCKEYGSLPDWMKMEKERAKVNYQKNYKTPDYASFSTQSNHDYNFTGFSPVQPFSPLKMKLAYFAGRTDHKGFLEDFDLNEMRYIGYLKSSSGKNKAFINVKEKVYTILNGTPIGKNYGRVVNITPKKIIVRENVETFEGLWKTRDVEIEMSKDQRY